MLTDSRQRLPLIEISGSPFDVGLQLGRHGAKIVNSYLKQTHAWASVMALKGSPRIIAAQTAVEQRFPRYWRELEGLAAGLDLPVDDVFAWNSRGDVWAMAPDGCTTVQLPGPEPIIGHNEDGQPGLRNGCALARIASGGGRTFTAFVYPGSIPGHTFALNDAGLVLTVNNIRSLQSGDGLPRMMLARAVVDCVTIDEAVELLQCEKRAGAFHFTLAQAGVTQIVSVEFTHGACSVREINGPSSHANHLIHPGICGERQAITGSSKSRQRRSDQILEGVAPPVNPLDVLWDRQRGVLPIYREQPDDPDDENTLATAVFKIRRDRVEYQVYDRVSESACFDKIEVRLPT